MRIGERREIKKERERETLEYLPWRTTASTGLKAPNLTADFPAVTEVVLSRLGDAGSPGTGRALL